MPENTVKFKYIFEHDYNPKYANGAYGGITTRGEISVNFYYERPALPHEQLHSIKSDGTVGELIEVQPSDNSTTLVRVVENGVILSKNTAKDIVRWLSEKIDLLEKAEEDAIKASKK